MLFTTDKQTLDDLNIFGRHGADSIYHIFNRCATRGGATELEDMFLHPFSDDGAINQRAGIIQRFAADGRGFPFDASLFDQIETYLANTDERTKLGRQESSAARLGRMIAADNETAVIYKGVQASVSLLQAVRTFAAMPPHGGDGLFGRHRDVLQEIVTAEAFAPILASKGKPGHATMAEFDVLLRFRHRALIREVLRHLYLLDVYMAVAVVARERGFAFPKALPRGGHPVELEGVYHPHVKQAVANDIAVSSRHNLIFLTGANMAGKSTFMKSFGISMYLAHMGFPVPARRMSFPVMDGIYTTINLPDNLGMGASHFYAEVLRVKKMANELKQGKHLFVIFDELFRGTNVKDAYDATVAITTGFAAKANSLFVISTHIIEAGDVLKKACPGIRCLYLPTRMKGNEPVYTYKLEEGITDDRHGMIIIRNEGILSMLREGADGSGKGGGVVEEPGSGAEFIADRQTVQDLNLLGRFKPNSIFSLFNKARTRGGQRLLEEMFSRPMTDARAINQRSATFSHFQSLRLTFPFQYESFLAVESYIGAVSMGNALVAAAGMVWKKAAGKFLRDQRYAQLSAGLTATIDALKKLRALLGKVDHPMVQGAKAILLDARLSRLLSETIAAEMPVLTVARYDLLLRHTLRNEMDKLLQCIYQLDVFIAVGDVARARSFSYAQALPAAANCIRASALWHPSIDNAVANPVASQPGGHVLFLTGANMAGKSTFMKSFGIAVYLAHMGFPVAARDMAFSVRDGLYSSINVADNLNLGYSHFYAEVLRVKTVAEQVSRGRRLVVIFDELFKGTNVKDAYDATLQLTSAFTRYDGCFFIISTHIIEAGHTLRDAQDAVRFQYLPTIMEGAVPRYTYQLMEGITGDRHGMVIITNEKILETLNE